MKTLVRRLGVNVDHVATLRQARRSPYPDPVEAALLAEQVGAQQITCHLRCDRRHVQERDIRVLGEVVTSQLNVEVATTDEMMRIMEELRPHRVTLVPERAEEVTTEGGLDVAGRVDEVRRAVDRLRAAEILVALFIDPDERQIEASALPGVDQIELNTDAYAVGGEAKAPVELLRLGQATNAGWAAGLTVAAGHGLTHRNLLPLVRAVPEIVEYNIGHSIVSRAVFVGWERAVGDLLELLR